MDRETKGVSDLVVVDWFGRLICGVCVVFVGREMERKEEEILSALFGVS